MESQAPYDLFRTAAFYFERRHGTGFRKWLAGKLGVEAPRVSRFLGSLEKQPNKPAGIQTQIRVAELFGMDYLEFLLLGKRLLEGYEPEGPGGIFLAGASDVAKELRVRMLPDVNGAGEARPIRDAGEDYEGVPLYEEGRLAAGANGLAMDPWQKPASHVVIYRPELHGRHTHKLAAFRVGGDSMSPTITQGSIVVADLSDRNFLDRRVYVVNNPDDELPVAAVKRVSKFTRGYTLISDNQAYPPEPVETEWQDLCLGRVVWAWKSMEDG